MGQCGARSHITDSRFYYSGYTTDEAKAVFCDLYRYQRWLDVEAALSEAQAELGMIPKEAATEIRKNADIRKLDMDKIKKDLAITNHSLMPLLNALSSLCSDASRRFIHYGATTQDIQDTAESLEIKDVLDILERELVVVMGSLADLAARYKSLVVTGRTHTQDALPMTLGLKMAGWLDELWRGYERLQELRPRVLVSELFGGVGTMDAFGDKGLELLDVFSKSLGLYPAMTSWHNARDRVAEFLSWLGLVTGGLARMADEIRGLARSSIGELEEPFHQGKLGSSTMPHKRNPELCEQVVVLSRLVCGNAGLGLSGLVNEHERDYRSVRLEWVTVADSSQYACAAFALSRKILDGIIVHKERINKNLRSSAPYICSEALMFYLGKRLGKDRAHRLIYEASMEAVHTGRQMVDVLMEAEEIKGAYSKEELESVFQPEGHIGLSERLTDRLVSLVKNGIDTKETGWKRLCPLAQSSGNCSVKP